jgi:hypothetical protein
MASYQIEAFEFLSGCIVFEDDERTKWRVRLPPEGLLDCGLGSDALAALGADKDRVVGRVICRLKDGAPALAALYLDSGGELHWGEPYATEGSS